VSPGHTSLFDRCRTSSRVARALADDTRIARVLRVLGTTLYSDSTALVAMGVDGEAQSLYTVTRGDDIDAAPPDGRTPVLVNENAALALGVDVGDGVDIDARVPGLSSAFADDSATKYIVAGIVAIEFDLPQQRTIVLPIDAVYRLLPEMRDQASFVLAKVHTGDEGFAPIATQREVVASVAAQFPELSVYSIDQLLDALQGQLAYFKQFARILSTISVFITFLLIAVVLTIGVGERRGEIAALRSMGFSRSSIRGLVLGESAALLLLGSIAGSILGWCLAGYLDRILTQSPSLPAGYRFFIPDVREIATAIAITALAGALAALLPAYFAARVDIPRALHEEVV
jgi:ABC-type lipoprotein release transport system permease subunit